MTDRLPRSSKSRDLALKSRDLASKSRDLVSKSIKRDVQHSIYLQKIRNNSHFRQFGGGMACVMCIVASLMMSLSAPNGSMNTEYIFLRRFLLVQEAQSIFGKRTTQREGVSGMR